MDSVDEIMRLCRLCLVKDGVNIPIFEEQGDIRQIFLKISACLPVKVSREDNLPKNICDGCSCKLETLYQFWNTSANSEKKLMKWLSQGGVIDKHVSDKHSMNIDPVILKQEVVEVPDDRHSTDDDLVPDDLNVSNDAEEYLIQQQQLPYQNVEFQFQQDEFDQTGTEENVVEATTPSRKRRAAAIRAMANMGSEEEDNPDLLEPKIAKTEEESEESCNEDPEPTTFVGVPLATDNEQPGPSGVSKPAADAPFDNEEFTYMKLDEADTEQLDVADDHLVCCLCKALFWNRSTLISHQKAHSILCVFKCSFCQKVYNSLRILNLHVNVCEGQTVSKEGGQSKFKGIEPAYKCCEQHFSNFNKLLLHLRSTCTWSSGLYTYCNSCATLLTTENWDEHSRICDAQVVDLNASVKNPYNCGVCSKQFNDLFEVLLHGAFCRDRPLYLRKSHVYNVDDGVKVVQKISYKCEMCNAQVKNLKTLLNHKLSHLLRMEKPAPKVENNQLPSEKTDEDVIVLDDDKFSVRQSLNVHPESHRVDKKYACDSCEKTFKSLANLTNHLKIHSSDKSFKCKRCDKEFSDKILLVFHERVHTKVKSSVICARKGFRGGTRL